MGILSVQLARTVAAILSLAALLTQCSDPAPLRPKHVVLIVVDTLRADHLSTYGYRRPTSPELDKLAKSGVVFEQAASQGSWTVPSMVSMMTGAYLSEELMRVPEEQATVAQVFQRGGFATGAFIYNDVIDIDAGFQPGFELFEFKDAPYGPIDKIAAWFAANKGRKSFTYIHLNEAHDPYAPPSEYDRFVREKDSIPAARLEYYREITRDLKLAEFDRNIQHINEQIGGYDDDVAYSDAHIGRILTALRAGGEWEETAIVIAADHGEGLWTRPQFMTSSRAAALRRGDKPSISNTLQMTHGNLVNVELVHVPLIMVAPGMPKGVRVKPWVENVDIAPTLLELCDLPLPPSFKGASLLPLWNEPEVIAHQKRGSFSHTRLVSSFLDQDGFQLILPTPLGECQFDLEPELYDLRTDPEARVNLAKTSPDVVRRLSDEVKSRLSIGISEYQVPSAGQLSKLNALGYIDANIVNTLAATFAKLSVEELLTEMADPKNINCLVRIELLRSLGSRKLNDEQRAQLHSMRTAEISKTIQDEIDRVLAQ